MSYYQATTLNVPFDEAVRRTEAALAGEGFGVLTRIDVARTMQDKIGADMKPYVILGACNPRLAFDALQLDNKVGTMLPCNVVVQETDEGRCEVAAVDPVASMQAIDNPALREAAAVVRGKLAAVVEAPAKAA